MNLQKINNEFQERRSLDFIEDIKNAVQQGEIDALPAFVYLKQIAEVAGDCHKKILDQALEEREKYGKENPEVLGREVHISAGRSTYRFSDFVKTAEQAIKERKALEKQAAKTSEKIITEDGEVIPPAQKLPGKTTLKLMKK